MSKGRSPHNRVGNTAQRIGHPALVAYLIQVYGVLWAQAVPLAETHHTSAPAAPTSPNSCRPLSATSRTHLGALLVASGIVEADRREQ
ncbi:hypothetical protein P5W92_27835 [Streptomyces sp. J15]|uniref:Uncharacterized protein n=1 Tax=Streptomyces pakalii TaxID=3036494 RepID=A0ABT7DEE1_9ACTN|nr:hypothetical protein [Streptomyces pakalii]MDJ1644191.1 hypothetical protein [Streptomyces pakalii]